MLGLPGLGVPELLLLIVLALIIFGPGKLPEVGRSVGKAIGEFRRASAEGHRDDAAGPGDGQVEKKS